MLHVFALGAVGGVVCGAVKRFCFRDSDRNNAGAAAAAAAAAVEGSSIADTVADPRHRCSNLLRDRKALTVAASTVCACAAAAGLFVMRQQRKGKRQKGSRADRNDGRIPLQDLIRFKERQWFVEELENAREADPNAMLRLAKMYLHGQGCQRNIALAQEWVRKARNMGVPASLDELFATDDPDPRGRLRALMAQEERRRAARRAGGGGGGGSGYPQQQQQQRYSSQHTAAA
uniref:Uncharacterized protein n=1 Tax=Tetradesmus obliquus TaxID=3088 RepID=A0A383WCI4_TETOB|eukprot:jgi/Sobl393_1/191/SZX74930.1